jgi:Dolichyl-phosphate-mannose-protein mannosyltransferase
MKLHPSAYGIALGAIALHLAFNHRFGYYRDEFYFIDCARHLAWGYVDQPPLAPLVAWATAPLAYSVWALRLIPAILAGVVVLFACAIARELRGNGFAQAMTAVTVTLAPGLMGLAYGLSTEFFSPAAWTALIYLTIRLVKTGTTRLYLPIALVVTIGLYAKYSIAACALALAIALLATGYARLLRSTWLALGVALVALLTLPNALWQLQHGFPILQVIHNDQLNRHALANGIADESAQRWVNAGYMLATQLAYQNPFFAPIWIWGLIWLWRPHEETRYRFITVAYILLLALLVLTVGRGYYIEGFYPTLLAAGCVALERALKLRARRLRAAVLSAAVIAGSIFVPIVLPVLSLPAYMRYEAAIGLSRPTPPAGVRHLINPLYADQLGWNSMTATVAGAYWALPAAQRAHTAVFADRYAYAGALDFYGPRYGLPVAISPNNQYYLWGTRGYTGESILAVGATDYHLLLQHFGSVRQIAVYRNDYRWILEGPLPIYLCTQPHAPLALMWPNFKYYGL